LIVHGWPGSVYEFYKLIPMLVDPEKQGIKSHVAFEVVVPSIPGYGWSEQPHKKGFFKNSISSSKLEIATSWRPLKF
jgi:microsomal epoxide hydrolase